MRFAIADAVRRGADRLAIRAATLAGATRGHRPAAPRDPADRHRRGSAAAVGGRVAEYLVAVVGIGVVFGTASTKIAAAVASFLLYDALFVEPRFTLAGRRSRKSG